MPAANLRRWVSKTDNQVIHSGSAFQADHKTAVGMDGVAKSQFISTRALQQVTRSRALISTSADGATTYLFHSWVSIHSIKSVLYKSA